MYWRLGLNLLVVSSLLLGALGAKDTALPAGLPAAIEASRHALERDGAGYKASNPGQHLELRFEPTGAWVRAAGGGSAVTAGGLRARQSTGAAGERRCCVPRRTGWSTAGEP